MEMPKLRTIGGKKETNSPMGSREKIDKFKKFL